MPDQTSPTLTREAVIAAIDAAKSNLSPNADGAIRNIRKRLPDFFARHGRMPETLKELASLQVAELTRFKTIAKDVVELSGGSTTDPEIAQWKLTQFFQRTVNSTDAEIMSTPGIGDATVGVFRFMANLYTSLGLLTELDANIAAVDYAPAPLVTAWRDACAALDKMDVVGKLEFLLTQKDDIIAANSRTYFKALKNATDEYYGKLLTEDLIGSPENIIITRHVVGKHMDVARLGRNAQTVLRPYIGSVIGNKEIAFVRSYLATIRDDIQQKRLDELPLKLKMLGRLYLSVSKQSGAEPPIAANTKMIAADVAGTASEALVACVDTARISDAIEIMYVMKHTIGDDVVVSSGSFLHLLEHVAARHADYGLTEFQAMRETLGGYAKRRQELKQLTPAHTAKLEEMAGHETGVRQAMIGRLAQRLTAKPAAGNENQ